MKGSAGSGALTSGSRRRSQLRHCRGVRLCGAALPQREEIADAGRVPRATECGGSPEVFAKLMSLLSHLTFLPRGYSETATDQWPLMLFLHGAGERGHELRKLRRYGPPRIVESDPD